MKISVTLRVSLAALLVACFAGGFNNAFAQGEQKLSPKKLPQAVLTAFQRLYPHANIKGASTEVEKGVKYYEIESVDGGLKRDLLYKDDGTCVEIEESLPAKDLPGGVREAVKKEFAKGKIRKSEKLTKGGIVQYECLILLGKTQHEVVFDPSGTIVKNTAPKSGEKEKKDEEDEKN